MAEKKIKRKVNKRIIFAIIINLMLIVTCFLLVSYILKLKGIENILRIVGCVVLVVVSILLMVFNFKLSKKDKNKKYIISIIFSIIFLIVSIFGVYTLRKIFNTLDKVTTNVSTVSVSLVTLESNKVSKLSEISSEDELASVSKEISESMSLLIDEFCKTNKVMNALKSYDGYIEIIEALYEKEIKYAFLPTDYQPLLNSYDKYSDDSEDLKIIASYEKAEEVEETVQKSVLEPFTVLFMGVDTLSASYNADTLLVVTFNPELLSATMLSIPRDTYTTISCTGRKHKINSSGWSGDKCVVSTIEKYLDVDIDYYFKINFKGIVDLVDALGGVEVDVPYTFCEQNSKRKWGKNTIYVDKGLQKLNGEQALALARNRKYWPYKCDSKYTTEGIRNDFTRGQNQQLVFKSILNSLKNIDSISTVYNLLDSLGSNMVTNMKTDTILSLYDVGKDMLLKLNANDKDISKILNIHKLKFTSYTQTIAIGKLNLSTVINHDNSVKAVTNAMKTNLNLAVTDPIKEFNFDINNDYKEDIIGDNTYGGSDSVSLLPNFVGKDYKVAQNWGLVNGVSIKITYKHTDSKDVVEGEILSQSKKPKTDISTLRTLTIEVATKVNSNTSTEEFSYKQCLQQDSINVDACIIKNYVGFDVNTFKSWINSTGLTIPVNYTTVEGTDNKIVSQSITNISIYELINTGISIDITHNEIKEKEEEKEPAQPEEPKEDKPGQSEPTPPSEEEVTQPEEPKEETSEQEVSN